ncbi:Restriction endonuclease [Ruminococcaceae bacterium YRB3002]|nr:Restriction endonuclease [Ruminococcaceae bacterium YRB3002]
MDGREYERRVADYLRSHGYHRVSLTRDSGDYGVDIVCSRHRHKYAVQCKFYAKPVGVSAVQQVVGGMAYYECDRAMVVTNSTFTRQASELAEKNDVILLDGIRPNLKLRRTLLILFVLMAGVLMLFTDYVIYAGIFLAIYIILVACMLYLRHKAIQVHYSDHGEE